MTKQDRTEGFTAGQPPKGKPYIQKFPNLCAPIEVGRRTLRNRMYAAPVGFPDLTEDGCLTEGAIAFYERRAKGGAAVVTISEALPDYGGNSHSRMINLQNPNVLPGLTNAARAIQKHGALACIEFGHAGALAGSAVDSLNSDAQSRTVDQYVMSLDCASIRSIVVAYGKAAALVKRAGFDMILVHAGHGWLLHQFLSPKTNHRTDDYGGSLENRARFTLEILDAIRKAVGPGFPIELRMSAVEADPEGINLSQSISFAMMVQNSVDLLHISAGGIDDFYSTHPSMFSSSGVNVEYAAKIKEQVQIPVAVVGALNEPSEMEQIIAQGKADIVCMARGLIADPDLPSKVMQNRDDEILRCLKCLVCHAERAMTQTRICALNPQIGREYEAKFEAPVMQSKRVLVVGGGPGGMQCALTAARRGHDVTLCEKSSRLGGNLNCETNVPLKTAFPKYTKVMAKQMEQAGVKVRLQTEVTPEFVRKFAPDALMIAVGADPLILPLPGIDGDNVILATDLDTREDDIGKRVVVLGGGLVGCESGLYLAQKGHNVTIVEMREEVAIDANIRHRPILLQKLQEAATILTNAKAKAVTEQGLICQREDGSELLVEADTVLSASGLRPRTELVNALRSTAPIVYAFGDCVKPGIIRGATFPAYHAALDLG